MCNQLAMNCAPKYYWFLLTRYQNCPTGTLFMCNGKVPATHNMTQNLPPALVSENQQ